MRTPICRTAGIGRTLCFVALVMAFTSASAPAQVNSWTNSTSGNWDQASSWSLGVLPGSSQSVMITNALAKTVAINPSTPVNFPDAMTVSNLTLRGASGAENSLLLNYAGTTVPLTVLNGVTLQDDGRILNFNSALVVQGGTLVVSNATMIQDGGLVRATNAPLYLSGSEYDLTNGVFEGGVVWVGRPVLSRFNQYGGDVTITQLILGPKSPGSSYGGAYALYGGNLNLPGGLTLLGESGQSASYIQAGGTNRTTQVLIEPGLFGISPSFKLNGGLLADNDVSILSDDFGSATLEQNGGTHLVSNILHIAGGSTHGQTTRPGTYRLNDGTLAAGSIDLNATFGDAVFIQSNGMAQVAGIQANSGGSQNPYFVTTVNLSGGRLSCSNLFITDGGGILQSGGALTVSTALGVVGYRQPGPRLYTTYKFFGGTLVASNINIGGSWIIGDGGTNRISNPGTCSLSYTLQIGNAVEQLGRFILASNATVDLAGNASRLSFANSRGETWTGGATLVVADWNGDPSGGGAEQLKFGTDQTGLTAAQLNQIQFSIGTNLYPAKILNTGEVVPDQGVPPVAQTNWVDDGFPAGAWAGAYGGDSWNWIAANPAPFSGSLAHQSSLAPGIHYHYFVGVTAPLQVNPGDAMFFHVFLDPANLPREIMVQWFDGNSWSHSAYWGENLIPWGVNGTASQQPMGPLPPAGQWARLEVPSALVGLEGAAVTGMNFVLYDGRAAWDLAGAGPPQFTYPPPVVQIIASDSLARKVETLGDPNPGSPNSGEFLFWRSGDVSRALTVNYAVSGSATSGVDFQSLPGSITFPVGANVVTTTLTPINNGVDDADQLATLALVPDPSYAIGTFSNATVDIVSRFYLPDARWHVDLYVIQDVASEATGDPGVFILTRSQADREATSALTASYATSGDAVRGIDYQLLSTSVTMPVGQNFALALITPVTHTNFIGTRTATLTVSAGNYDVTRRLRASVFIRDGNSPPASKIIWEDDSLPAGAWSGADGGDSWNWISDQPVPFLGAYAHQSASAPGIHYHYFASATAPLAINPGDKLFVYVFLDGPDPLSNTPAPPREIMVQWFDGSSWAHAAYWGENLIPWGTDRTASQFRAGNIPATGRWVKLEVSAQDVGLGGAAISGMNFVLYDSRATWDFAGVERSAANPQSLFVADSGSGNIYRLAPDGTRTTFASGMSNVWCLAFDEAGNLFASDFGANAIYKFAPDGTGSTFAPINLYNVVGHGLAFDRAGNLFVAPVPGAYIYKISPDGRGGTFGPAMTTPGAMAFDRSSNLFITAIEWVNPGRGGSPYTRGVIYKFTPDGTQSTFTAGNTPISNGGAFDSTGNLFFSSVTDGNIYEYAPNGTGSVFATGLNHPAGLAFDTVGNLYVADNGSGNIYALDTNGMRTTFATGLGSPAGIAFSPAEK